MKGKENKKNIFHKTSFFLNVVLDNVGAASVVLAVTYIIIGVLIPIQTEAIRRLIASIVNDSRISFYTQICVLLAIIVISVASEYILPYLKIETQRQTTLKLEKQVLRKINQLPYASLASSDIQDLLQRLKPPAEMVVDTLDTFFRLLECFIALLGLIELYFKHLPYYIIPIVILLILTIYFNTKEIKELRALRVKDTNQERKLAYIESLFVSKSALKEMKLFGFQDYLLKYYQKHAAEMINHRTTVRKTGFKHGVIAQGISLILTACGILSLIRMTILGKIEISTMIALATTIPMLLKMAAQQIPFRYTEYYRNCDEWSDYAALLQKIDFYELKPSMSGDESKRIVVQKIEFENVTFTYPGREKPALDHISFSIEANQIAAIVGCNGAGKSTLVKLILALYYPDSGIVRINGKPTSEYAQGTLLKSFATIFQDFPIFEVSLKENIELGYQYNDWEMEKVIREVELSRLVNCLTAGLETQLGTIGNNPVSLSGGEKQKVALARALITGRSFFIFDEPTAAMDPMAENTFYTKLKNVFVGRSGIIISHRLATAKLADKIILINNSSVSEIGSHDELMRNKGLYAEMFEKQAVWYASTDSEDNGEAT